MPDDGAIFNRRLPHNIDAEMAVIGSVFVFGRKAFDRVRFLAPNHFILTDHQLIWERCAALAAQGVTADPVTLRSWADSCLNLPDGYLVKLADSAASPKVAADYARGIVNDACKRQIIAIADIASADAYNGTSAIDAAREAINALSSIGAPGRMDDGEDSAALVAKDFPPVREHIAGLIPDGLTLLCAKPKVGKSWLLLDMALAIAGGGCAATSLQATKGRACLLMLEDSMRRLKGRLITLTAPAGVPAGVQLFCEWPRGAEGVAQLEEWLDQHPDVTFVGVDVLAKFRAPVDSAANSYQADYEAVAMLQGMAQRRGIAVVVVHHLRKAESDDPMDLISGTLGLTGAADHLIVITGNKDSGHKLTAKGRDIPDASWQMAFEHGRWTILGDTEPVRATNKVDRMERDQHIRDLARSGKSLREIGVIVGMSKSAVERVVKAGEA